MRLLVFLLFVFVLAGCSSLPTPPGGTSPGDPPVQNPPPPTDPIAADYSTGIPIIRIEDFSEPVESWWVRHPFNPVNGGFRPDLVVHPEPVVDVCLFKEGSDTGGIEEALATCPLGGCTLWFWKDCGPYVIDRPGTPMQDRYEHSATIQIKRRSNLHFLSDGATIAAGPNMDPYSFMIAFKHMGLTDTGDEGKNLQRNLYFENLIIDANQRTSTFVNTNGYQDIVWYDVTFTDFRDHIANSNTWGVIEHVIQPDNVWCIRCRFDSGFHAMYWDGIHGGGVLDSVFEGDFANVPIDIKTNDDASPFSAQPRSTQFMVIEGNEIVMNGGLAAIQFSAANSLIAGNHVTGHSQRFVEMNGKWSGTLRGDLIYEYFGNVVRDNVVEAALSFAAVEIRGWGEDLDYKYYRIGRAAIHDNRFVTGSALLRLNTAHPLGAIQTVDLYGNYVEGDDGKAVEIVGGGTVEDIRIRDNVFVNTAQGYDGSGQVIFENNEWR